MNKWKDITGYSKGEERIPRSWELILGRLRIVITRLHGHDPEQWYGRCFELGITDIHVGAPGLSVENAQQVMLKRIQKLLKEALSNVNKAL